MGEPASVNSRERQKVWFLQRGRSSGMNISCSGALFGSGGGGGDAGRVAALRARECYG